jgi:radical SAM protein with 4Fe4S-binding SPASM domain
MENYKNKYLILPVSDTEYIVYNSIKHIPIKISIEQLLYFNILFDKTKLNNLTKKQKNEYNEFVKKVKEIKFLSLKDDFIDKKKRLNNENTENSILFYLSLTNKCNLKCKYCYNYEHRKTDYKDFSFTKWKQIIDKIIVYANQIVITGGECTLVSYFYDIISYIKQNNSKISLTVISNGNTNYKENNIISALKMVDNLKISCDNLSDNPNERINFNKNIFFQNIKLLKDNNINNITIASVWVKGKEEDLYGVRNYCKNNKLAHTTTMFLPNNKNEINKIPDINLYKTYESIKIFDDNEVKIIDQSIKYKSITCEAANKTYSIAANGDIYPCQSFHYNEFKLGNITNQNFLDIHNSNLAQMFRYANDVNYIEKCCDCNIKYICGGGCLANTYRIEGKLFRHPKELCEYYRSEAEKRLTNIDF